MWRVMDAWVSVHIKIDIPISPSRTTEEKKNGRENFEFQGIIIFE